MKLAVLGATGAVGRTMLRVLEERAFPVDELVPIASPRSEGMRLGFGGRGWTVRAPTPGIFRGCDLALFSAGADRSREWAPRAAGAGAVVVDNSSAWRMDPRVPLVVPEVNAGAIGDRPRGIVANPNCSTIQLVVVLEAIRRVAGLRRVLATTFQSVSGAGQTGRAALEAEHRGREPEETPFPAPIAGNAIPQIGPLGPGGWTQEEEKLRSESRKILGLAELPVAATCVRVPVEVGHGVAATIATEEPCPPEQARAALREMPGVELAEEASDLTPRAVAGCDAIRVGRLREDPDVERRLHLWVVADNLRKGAATNAVQIAAAVVRA